MACPIAATSGFTELEREPPVECTAELLDLTGVKQWPVRRR